jgi:hypothetical protein
MRRRIAVAVGMIGDDGEAFAQGQSQGVKFSVHKREIQSAISN